MRARPAPLLRVAALALSVIAGAAACRGVLGLDDFQFRIPCASDDECDDGDPCTADACGAEGRCESAPAPDGPQPFQVPGDCRVEVCAGGQPASMLSDTDVNDDGNDCTTDTCVDGEALNTAKPDQTACAVGDAAGLCDNGACAVACGAGLPACDDGNPCTTDACDAVAAQCVFTPLHGVPVPGQTEAAGNCQLTLCVDGEVAPLIDDEDLPLTLTDCDGEVCVAGTPVNPSLPPGTPCLTAGGRICDGAGLCVQCNDPTDCIDLPADTECAVRTCVAHVCGQDLTPMGTPISTQTTGDCQQVVCDAQSSTTSIPDDADVFDDVNECTTNGCDNGTPTLENVALNDPCGQGGTLYCNGAGACVGCNDAAQCPAGDFCKTATCTAQQCSFTFTANGTALPPPQQIPGDCKELRCNGAGLIVPANIIDLPNDSNQCTSDSCSAGTPTFTSVPAGTMCSQSGGQQCDGLGACKKVLGQACAAAGECLSTFCVDNVCCNAACSGSCVACSAAGSCQPVPSGPQDTCPDGSVCDAAGACKKTNGQVCGASAECLSGECVDGVCCTTPCDTACRACNIANNLGNCVVAATGQQDLCDVDEVCASGACLLVNGETCAGGGECASGFCADGVCCNAACGGTCDACDATGMCVPVPAGQMGTCAAGSVCDAMGLCKKELGESCATGGECLSTFCADNVCCDAACGGTCDACNAAGACVAVAPGQPGTCAAGSVCDAAGLCKKELGETCAAGGECLSAFCADGVCCNAACDGACDTCDAAGACALEAAGQPGTCSAGNVCDAAGMCKLLPGEPCSAPEECFSVSCTLDVCD